MSTKKKVQRPTKETLGIEFRGVSPHAWRQKDNGFNYSYRSRIYHEGVEYYLGSYSTPTEAAVAYNKKAKSIFRSEKNAKKRNMWNVIEA